MRLEGNLFEYPMEINEITIVSNTIRFHNHDEIGQGYVFIKKISEEVNEAIKFVLNEKDYRTLSTFDMFTLEFEGGKIKVRSGKVKVTFANMVEFKTYDVNFKDMKKLNINFDMLLKASRYAANDKVKIQANGVNVMNGRIVASDGTWLYENELETTMDFVVNVHKDTFKKIPRNVEDIEISYKERLIHFKFNNIIYYSNLIESHLSEKIKVNGIYRNKIKVNRNTMLNDIKLIGQYDKYADLIITKDKVILSGRTELENIEIEEEAEFIDYKEDLTLIFNISKMQNVLSVTDQEKIEILFSNDAMIIINEKEKCMLLRVVARI